jgi:DNA (cytosine-5)-methyltransferase 1
MSKQQQITGAAIHRISETKGRGRRLYLEKRALVHAGFARGTRFTITEDRERSLLTLDAAPDGKWVVSGKAKGGDLANQVPVIDIALTRDEILQMFAGIEAVRVVLSPNRISILPVASELRAKRRLERIKAKMAAEQAIEVGSLASGIGILDLACTMGLGDAGLTSHLAFSNEIREDCAEHAEEKNPAHQPDTIALNLPMQELAFDQYLMAHLPEADLLTAGIPCSGASVAGRSKRGLTHPESHPEVGHLVVPFLAIVAKANPAVVVLENVPPYASSASAAIIRTMLGDLGYDVIEAELNAEDWNLIEHRKRWVLIAVTKGMSLDMTTLERPAPRAVRFGDIMDDVPLDASTWGTIGYLWAKEERDKAAGKGFAPTVVDAASDKLPTLNKTLHKRQSTGTFIAHPEDLLLPMAQQRYRIPTVAEHARAKGVPEELVADTTQTFGHEILGQAVSFPTFRSVFQMIGRMLKGLGNQHVTPSFVTADRIAA